MPSVYGFNSLKSSQNISKIIILGSASHIHERLLWHRELADFIDIKLKRNIPTLGLCFGHQLMADFYGCEVGYIDSTKLIRKELREITFTEEVFDYEPKQKITLPYAHAQIVKSISSHFTTIASSDEFQYEALAHKEFPFIGFQAHPEASEIFLSDELGLIESDKVDNITSSGMHLLKNFCLQG